MLFNSYIFLVFLGIVLPLYYFLPSKFKKLFLLVSSYTFYGYWDWRFTSLLALSTIVDFVIGSRIFIIKNRGKRKKLLVTSLIVNLGILSIFKYFGFFVDSFSSITQLFGSNLDYLHLNIILPVGISFYTFQTMSYTIDIYRRKMEPTNSIIDFAVFVAFFPQLVAGPIERARNLLPQIQKLLKPTKEQISQGIVLIITGLFTKVMIGDTSGRIVDQIFSKPEIYNSPELIAGLTLFSIQIYADFSGYSSIARGVAKLLGIELMKNFEQPYLSSNITEFWRRWHISLSSWLKDYLYFSLGGSRKGKNRTYVNLMLTMLLGGLWHGSSWNFVIWGGLHGVYLGLHKLMLGKEKPKERYQFDNILGLIKYISKTVITFILVLITWLFFRASEFETIQIFFFKMVNWEPSDFTNRLIIITSSFLLITLVIDFFMYYTKKHTFILAVKNKTISFGILTAIFLTTLLYMFQSDPLPFIYFQF